MRNREYEIQSAIKEVISENIPIIEKHILSELLKRQAKENERVAANKERFHNEMHALKASLKNTMRAYTDQRQQYISEKILQFAPFKFFLGETKKNEKNESVISVFSNIDSDQYSLALYEKFINEIDAMTDLNSGNIALQNMRKLLTDEAKIKSPTLCGYARLVIDQLSLKLKPSDYNIINFSNTSDRILFAAIKSLSEKIEAYADALLDKKLSEVCFNNPFLGKYNKYVEEVAEYHSTYMQITSELDSFKKQPIDYRSEVLNDLMGHSNPWTDTKKTEQEIQDRMNDFMVRNYCPLRQSQLQELEKAKNAAYIVWVERAKYAARYAKACRLSDKLIDLANGTYDMETKLKAFIPEKEIQSICSEIKTYWQSIIQAENTASSESDQFNVSGVSSMKLKR